MTEKEQRPKGDVKLISSKEFIRDPFAFGALMEFQYGEGSSQENAERIIFEQLQGINCKPEEIDWVLPNYDFLSSQKKEQKTRLYHNNELPSKVAITYLHQAGFDFSTCHTVFTPRQRLPLNSSFSEPVPVLINEGGYWSGAQKVAGVARGIALEKEIQKLKGQKGMKAWERRRKERNVGDYWRNRCYDANYKELFAGERDKAPFPIDQLMKPYGNIWDKVFCWKIGTIDEVVNDKGELSAPKAEAFLFPQDVKKLQKDGTFTSYNCSGMLAGLGIPHRELEAYAINKGTVYRLRASYSD